MKLTNEQLGALLAVSLRGETLAGAVRVPDGRSFCVRLNTLQALERRGLVHKVRQSGVWAKPSFEITPAGTLALAAADLSQVRFGRWRE